MNESGGSCLNSTNNGTEAGKMCIQSVPRKYSETLSEKDGWEEREGKKKERKEHKKVRRKGG